MAPRTSVPTIVAVSPLTNRLESGFEGIDVGHGLRVQLVRTDVEHGYIDFKKVV